MKVVLQRVSRASVTVNEEIRSIGSGLVVLLGVGPDDGTEDTDYLVRKISQLRIFADSRGKMNLSVKDIDGQILVVSQFTLYGDTRKGNRPGFNQSAPPEKAIPLYEEFVRKMETAINRPVITGEFGAHMKVELVNDGPVTIVMDSHDR